ncbi:LysR family transcriptional regulator [Pseudomonas sp. MPFS]|nr:LysR family transcriptional regulator [Pseudomonas sp. MPFS]
MAFRHLRCLLAVAEEQHFARPAGRLPSNNRTLSRAIREREEALGVVLFTRITRRPNGEAVDPATLILPMREAFMAGIGDSGRAAPSPRLTSRS